MLTDAGVRGAKAKVKVYELDAGVCPGLKLRVTPAGVKSWTLRYRTRNGDRRRITVGNYPDMSLKDARDEGLDVRNMVAKGRDPVAEREADRKALRMRDLLGETDPGDEKKDKEPGWYLGTYVKAAGRLGAAKTPESVRTDRVYIKKHLRPRKALMRKPVAAVGVADMERIKAAVTPGVWRKLRNILRVAFRRAEEVGAIPHGSNPAARVKATADRKVERYLGADERQRLNEALDRAERIGPAMKDQEKGTKGGLSKTYVRLFRLLALTGMRLGEALDLRWEFIDWKHGQLRLPTSKTGAKSVPLTRQTVKFLRDERGKVGRIGRVCGTPDGNRLDVHNVQRAWRSIRTEAKLPKLRIHDLRHSWASDAASAGVSLHVIGAVLGHRSAQTTARYAHLNNKAIREGLEKTGAAIERATQGLDG